MLAITAALTLTSFVPVVAAADPPGEGGTYVALGSSYAAGPGLLPLIDTGCMRSSADYAHRVADRYRMELVDVTCSGATTSDILSESQRTTGGGRVPPQIRAVTADTRLVTVTVGGNDLGYIGDLTTLSCLHAIGAGKLCGTARENSPTAADFDAVEHSLAEVVTAVRALAPNATVVLVDYLPVLDPDGATCAAVPLSAAEAIAFERTYNGLVEATARAAAATGAELARAGTDHAACSAQPWVSGFELPNPLTGKGIPYHPTDAGMAAVADSVAAALETRAR
ncbi:SGNH/GDSL hydrolase family protein [Nocardia inohanensis]|uniref:SGNH/GDSL hydrolase family protein n=1 Tax=Nocardia inohanensis TaxID=209246 RepID=UPI0008379236|nr:SGNH/GDSL hydrolase family protein [Nocardia inohanensis]